jgi:hypothetical protein
MLAKLGNNRVQKRRSIVRVFGQRGLASFNRSRRNVVWHRMTNPRKADTFINVNHATSIAKRPPVGTGGR